MLSFHFQVEVMAIQESYIPLFWLAGEGQIIQSYIKEKISGCISHGCITGLIGKGFLYIEIELSKFQNKLL